MGGSLRTALVCLVLLSGCAQGLTPTVGDISKPLRMDARFDRDNAKGLVVVSLRSQGQLTNNLYVYFQRAGSTPGDRSQMIKLFRAAGVPLAGSYSTNREYQIVEAEPGTYYLLSHTLGYYTNVAPGDTNRVSAYHTGTGAGYVSEGVSFDVKAGGATYVGDLILEIPISFKDSDKTPRFSDWIVRVGEPRKEEAMRFLSSYPHIDAELTYGTRVANGFASNVTCEPAEKALGVPWQC